MNKLMMGIFTLLFPTHCISLDVTSINLDFLKRYKKDERLEDSYEVNKNKKENIQKKCNEMYLEHIKNQYQDKRNIENCNQFQFE